MVVTCFVEFDNNLLGTFYAGQMVSGSVVLKADKPKDVKAIQLKVGGYAKTQWNERGTLGTRSAFAGTENYLDTKTYLLGTDENTTHTIQTGTHVYTFAVQLPYNCITSFEGRCGYIRYLVKVVLLRPWKFDQTYTRGFTVLKTVDLNEEAYQLRVPASTSAYRSFCCRPCKTEPLQLELHLPQTGYVPGQSIPVTAVVINNTNIRVKEVCFQLVMLVRYFSTVPSRHVRVERTAIAFTKGDSVLRNCTRSLTEELRVPSTPPSCSRLCNILQIVYQVEVEAKMQGWHGSQVASLPVTIGNVPLWSSGPMTPKQAAQKNNNDTNHQGAVQPGQELPVLTPLAAVADTETVKSPTTPGTPGHLYPDMPPPTYEEALHTERGDMNDGELHAFGPCPFAPLYPVFDVPSPSVVGATETPSGGYTNETYES